MYTFLTELQHTEILRRKCTVVCNYFEMHKQTRIDIDG